MGKKVLVLTTVVLLAGGVSSARYSGGTGEPDDPYRIATAADLHDIINHIGDLSKCFVMVNDIDLSAYSGEQFNMVGVHNWSTASLPFTGVFDGDGHTIRNFTYAHGSTKQEFIGIFGYVYHPNAQVKNVVVVDCNVDGGQYGVGEGALVGYLEEGTISDCRAEGGRVVGNSFWAGGLVGHKTGGTVTGCYSSVNVTCANGTAGGLTGDSSDGTISNCTATGDVNGGGDVGGLVGDNSGQIRFCRASNHVTGGYHVGGLAGGNYETISQSYSDGSAEATGGECGGLVGRNMGSISDCYSLASASAADTVGGLVGLNWTGTISNSYSAGSVSGAFPYGGLVARNIEGTTTSSFWDKLTSGQTWSDGGEGRNTGEMQTQSTFTNAGWDFTTPVWTMCEPACYPRLRWQEIRCGRYSGGSGTAEDPYLIASAADMADIGACSDDWGASFLLTADIDLADYTGTGFNIIGTDYDNPFTGVFDGSGHTISNFTYTSTGRDYIGLFGYVSGETAEIKNLGLINPSVDAGTGQFVGALAGALDDGSASDCYVEGGSVVGDGRTGGLVGYAYSGFISRCFATCDVTGDDWGTGGLIGYSSSKISACYATGSVIGDIQGTGGLVGYQFYNSISSSYATGGASASSAVGGLVGYAQGAIIRKAYAAGQVTGAFGTGGIVGSLDKYGDVIASFWDEDTTGQPSSSGGGTKKSTAEMQDPDTFRAEGWDFVGGSDGPSEVWAEPDGGGYPILWWQLSALPPLPSFSGGTGEPNDPYLISTAQDLNSIGYNPRLMESHFKLTDDIDLAGASVYTIGNAQFMYGGIFDGNGHRILNLESTTDDEKQVGLLGYVSGETAQVKDLGLIGADINAPGCRYVGTLVCWLHGTLSNCYCESVDVSGNEIVGGLIGWVAPRLGTVTDCCATGTVHGNGLVGGLAGENSGSISDCYAAVNVSNTGDLTGGLVGSNFNLIWRCRASGTVTAAGNGAGGFAGASYGRIDESCATGDVNGNLFVGGFVAYHSLGGTVSNCYSAGSVTGTECAGGFAGYNSDTGLTNCYAAGFVDCNTMAGGFAGYDSESYPCSYTGCFWDSDVSPDVNGIGNRSEPNVVGKSTAEMQTKSTFTDAGWDFVGEVVNGPNDVWDICEGTNYPRLVWQIPPADFLCPDGVSSGDYSFFAGHWQDTNCSDSNDCDKTDLDFSGTVDWADLKIFCQHWLEGL